MKKEEIALYLMLFSVIILATQVFQQQYQYNQLVDQYNNLLNVTKQNKCAMYDGIQHQEVTTPNGLYWVGEDYYCVWANNREFTDVEQTDRHEYCHYLVDHQYEHFCEGKHG